MYTDETLNVELGEQVGFGVTKWSSNLVIWHVVHDRWLKIVAHLTETHSPGFDSSPTPDPGRFCQSQGGFPTWNGTDP
jgi:hypothetical protein